MKVAKNEVRAAVERPNPATRFFLFHGPDEAGSRALAMRLLAGLGNAERFIVLGANVKTDPASLADEAGAMALFGGPRAIWIEPAGDEIAAGVAALLEAPASESAVVAVAGALPKTSAVLKLAESHALAFSHCSYIPDARDMERILADIARGLGLAMEPDVARRIAAASGNNQAIAERELEKLALYVGATAEGPRTLSHDAVDAVGADSAEADWLRLGDLALSGNMTALLDELGRLPVGGNEAIPVLRALQRRLLMLAPLRARVDAGERIDAVMTSLGKALFWKDKPIVQRMLGQWSSERLAEAAKRVAALEQQLMFANVADEAALGETLIAFARVGGRR